MTMHDRIPYLAAVSFSTRHAGRQAADLEELHSVANLAYAEALTRFDPALSPTGERGRGPFAAQAVRMTLTKHLSARTKGARMRRRQASLDAPLEGVGDGRRAATLGDLVAGVPDRGPEAVDDEEEWGRLLSVLPAAGRHREAARLHLVLGLSPCEIAALWGVSRQRVHQMIAACLERLSARHFGGLDPRPHRPEGAVRKSKRQQREGRTCRAR